MMNSTGGGPSQPGQHLVHSHAHEGDIPGTVHVKATDGDDTGYGQALFPVPAEDPNDPLQWSKFKKTMILVIICIYSFLGNSALLGVGPYISLWSEVFGVSQAEASTLISYPNLAYGLTSWLLVPLYLRFGRRPVMLGSMLAFIAGLAASSRATSFGGLMAARVVHCLGAGVCEALPVQLVNDIFFLHERGIQLGYYTFALCLAALATLPAAYMLPTKYSWRLFFFVILAFAAALFILAFFFVEETSYQRSKTIETTIHEDGDTTNASAGQEKPESFAVEQATGIPPRKSFLSTLQPWGRSDPTVPFFTLLWRSMTYFLVPQVLWVITSFGIIIGLGGLSFNFVFPIKITSSPYNWPVSSSGIHAVGSVLGFLLAVPFAPTSDMLAAYLTRRNNGIREAEMRLGVMLPAMIVGPVGLVVYGLTAQLNLHWIGFFFGAGMASWCGYFFYSFTLAYAVDSYNTDTSEMLMAMNVGKQLVSFGLGFKVLDWIMQSSYAAVISAGFGGILLANNLFLIVFMIWGKNIRRFMATSWLARLHGRESHHG
ncbi:putative MFS transporter [Xylaria cf. heliscus]|nr:putative MFS transporter [Xylaria cf. heliscus]